MQPTLSLWSVSHLRERFRATRDKRVILAYLLGTLRKDKKDQFEERYFSDDVLFSELQAAKRRLIEDYLLQRLPPGRRQQFEKYYFSHPYRSKLVDSIRAELGAAVVQSHLAAVPWHGRPNRFAFAVSVAAIIVAVAFFLQNRSLRTQVEQYAAQAQTQQRQGAPAPAVAGNEPLERLRLDPSQLRIEAGPARNPGQSSFRMKKETLLAELTLLYSRGKAGEHYFAQLRNIDTGITVSHGPVPLAMRDGMGQIVVTLAAADLPQGSYIMELKDENSVAVESYAFNILIE